MEPSLQRIFFFSYNNWALKQDHIAEQSNFGQDNCTSYCY